MSPFVPHTHLVGVSPYETGWEPRGHRGCGWKVLGRYLVGVLGRDLQEPRKYSSGRGGYSLYEELLWLLGLKYKMVKCLLFDSHRHLLYSL